MKFLLLVSSVFMVVSARVTVDVIPNKFEYLNLVTGIIKICGIDRLKLPSQMISVKASSWFPVGADVNYLHQQDNGIVLWQPSIGQESCFQTQFTPRKDLTPGKYYVEVNKGSAKFKGHFSIVRSEKHKKFAAERKQETPEFDWNEQGTFYGKF